MSAYSALKTKKIVIYKDKKFYSSRLFFKLTISSACSTPFDSLVHRLEAVYTKEFFIHFRLKLGRLSAKVGNIKSANAI